MKRLILPAVLCLALAGCGGSPDTPGAKAAHDRHENFEAIGKAFKTIGDELKKGAPDLAAIKTQATKINGFAPQVKDWFPAGSSPKDGVKTDALAAIWEQPDEFGKAAARFAEAAAALDAAAASGDLAAVRGATGPLGAACKSCHERFREKD
ncbi:cytochrome c [Novosphingobium sp. PS1R-30]|uniref:Cytochrome c n=1 Tax=Novosphingobium anseongense TaxID=3133436 RepID=A0ABU8RVV5_9SPHN|nr:MAG: cytochrome c [Novosphingobium sp.]